jgi:hypothetical protein
MKPFFLFILLPMASTALFGQTYTYDAMGNRTARLRSTDVFMVTIINVGQSGSKNLGGSNRPMTDWSWVYPTYTAPGNTPLSGTQSGPLLEESNAMNRRIFNEYQTPRYWTVDIRVGDPVVAANVRSIQYEMDLLNAGGGVEQTFMTIENNPAYLMFGNASQYTELYTLNHPAFGLPYSSLGIYDSGFPKGKYNWRIKAWDKPGVDYGPYPRNTTRNVDPTATLLLQGNYYLEIVSSGVRMGVVENTSEAVFAMAVPNPVTRTVTLILNDVKGQEITLHLVDATGRLVLNRTLTPQTNRHQEEIDMSSQSTGMHFIQVASPKRHTTLKVLKVSQD